MSRGAATKELFDVKASLHFNFEILTENNDKGKQRENREAEQNDERPILDAVIKVQGNRRTNDRNENKID